jgi:hypothetical protein
MDARQSLKPSSATDNPDNACTDQAQRSRFRDCGEILRRRMADWICRFGKGNRGRLSAVPYGDRVPVTEDEGENCEQCDCQGDVHSAYDQAAKVLGMPHPPPSKAVPRFFWDPEQ